MNELPFVRIYTDGSYNKRLHRGGWSALLTCGPHSMVLCDWAYGRGVTVNRMELTGAIKAFEQLNTRCDVLINSDSQYVVNGMNKWVENWQLNGWKKQNNEPVVNRDLWERLIELSNQHRTRFRWVKAHVAPNKNMDAQGNDLVDYFASNVLFPKEELIRANLGI